MRWISAGCCCCCCCCCWCSCVGRDDAGRVESNDGAAARLLWRSPDAITATEWNLWFRANAICGRPPSAVATRSASRTCLAEITMEETPDFPSIRPATKSNGEDLATATNDHDSNATTTHVRQTVYVAARNLAHQWGENSWQCACWCMWMRVRWNSACQAMARFSKCSNFCLSNAMHGQIINLPLCVCVCVCVCVHHTFCQLAYRSQQIFTVDSLKDAYLRKDVPFGGLDDE